MSKIKIIYGSTSGMTEKATEILTKKLSAKCINISDAASEDFIANLLEAEL